MTQDGGPPYLELHNTYWNIYVSDDNDSTYTTLKPGDHYLSFNDFPSSNTTKQFYVVSSPLFSKNVNINGTVNGMSDAVMAGYPSSPDDPTSANSVINYTGINIADNRFDIDENYPCWAYYETYNTQAEDGDGSLHTYIQGTIAHGGAKCTINNQSNLIISDWLVREIFLDEYNNQRNYSISCIIRIKANTGITSFTLGTDFDLYFVNLNSGYYFYTTLKSGSVYTQTETSIAMTGNGYLYGEIGWYGSSLDQVRIFYPGITLSGGATFNSIPWWLYNNRPDELSKYRLDYGIYAGN